MVVGFQQAAKELFIHPKTMSYRLKKINELTKIHLDNPEELLRITIGLRVLQILELRTWKYDTFPFTLYIKKSN